jgi:hypothetical protein
VVPQAGSVLLVETARQIGLETLLRHHRDREYRDREATFEIHGRVPAHSISAAYCSASCGEQHAARPSGYHVPGMSANTIA